MNDTERLDAIGNHGLCVAQHQDLIGEGWVVTWVVMYGQFGDRLVTASTIREAIDAAVLDLTVGSQKPH